MSKFQKIILFLKNLRFIRFAVPGHFYSPLPNIDEIDEFKNFIWQQQGNELPSINLNHENQKLFLEIINKYYSEIQFPSEKADLRYFFENPAYSYSDGIFLYTIMREYKPTKIIEVGSGYSSCLMIDMNEIYFSNKIEITLIEPYPKLLKSLIKETDSPNIIPNILQRVPLNTFKNLDENDILFIDSTHVSKINSDVNYIIHNILPILKKGVLIHIHDIFYPFEYPIEWTYGGRAWNEIYILRAFLQYNDSFEIVAFNTYIQQLNEEEVFGRFPLLKNNTGGSIWLRKTK
ncbi:MAG: class I SAM-dependent methyltransferase [Bacteroidetes bacterium]|nr:class I SAM-dependent methyltransferase [Bacteroidota bacterium]